MFVFTEVRGRYLTAEELEVREVHESVPYDTLGPFTLVRSGKVISGQVYLLGNDTHGVLDSRGRPGRAYLRVPLSPVGLKRRLRRVRPQEAAVITEADALIWRAAQALVDARAARVEAVQQAWAKGHVVPVSAVRSALGSVLPG